MRNRYRKPLAQLYPPSPPCTCGICLGYCIRPGWWTVEEAYRAFERGFAGRMMLEMAPNLTYGVLSPAFRGCEGFYALNEYKDRSCNFLVKGLCELHETGFQPLECRFCHHDRLGEGLQCHAALEEDWHSPAGQALVDKWTRIHLDGKGR